MKISKIIYLNLINFYNTVICSYPLYIYIMSVKKINNLNNA